MESVWRFNWQWRGSLGDARCTVLDHPSDDSFVQVKTYTMTRQPAVWFSLDDVLGDGAEDLENAQHEKRGHW
jgi:hypothetical protein